MSLAPIALFAYNRPKHFLQALNALAENAEAKDSILFIYCDGAKKGANEETIRSIESVKQIAIHENRFQKVHVFQRTVNKGLANSIIDGVTELLNKYERLIVLEDDIVPSPGFLKYMNDALNLYAYEDNVGCIHAWNYHLETEANASSTFFLKGADCWGWATWSRAWNLFNPNGKQLLEQIASSNLEYEFNRRGTYDYVEMLRAQINGENDSWAIRWHASLFLHGKYCLHPIRPIVKNIGLDDSGAHCISTYLRQEPVNFIALEKIPIQESDWFFASFPALKNENESNPAKWKRLKAYLKQLLPR